MQIDLRMREEAGAVCDHHLAQVAPPRSKGIHVSELIQSIAINTGKLKTKNNKLDHGARFNLDKVIDEENFPLPMAIGCSVEDYLSRQYPKMLYHIGEMELDDIYMSPDGVTIPDDGSFDFSLGSGIVEEIKTTWKSARKPIEAQWTWLAQVKSYCKALPTLCARLHVVYINGDYDYNRPGPPPQYIIYSLQFTQEELDDNWQMILNEKADWERTGRVKL